jgi:hypothetical protein
MICGPTIAMGNFVPPVSVNRRLTVVRYDNIAGVVNLPRASYREEISTHRHANRAHFCLRHNALDNLTIVRTVPTHKSRPMTEKAVKFFCYHAMLNDLQR